MQQSENDNGWVFHAPEKPEDLKEDGQIAYLNIWLYYFHRGEDWTESKDVEFNTAVLYSEVGTEVKYNGNTWSISKIIQDAAARRYNKNCSAGAWSSGCFNGYWGYYQPVRTASSKTTQKNLDRIVDKTIDQVEKIVPFYQLSLDIKNHNVVGSVGWDVDQPYDWVNVYDFNTPISIYHTPQRGKDNYWFIVLTPNQKLKYCGNYICNLSDNWIK